MRELTIKRIVSYYKFYPRLEEFMFTPVSVLPTMSNAQLLDLLEDCVAYIMENNDA
jgi:hypothetical protein